jgi:hypothetical protein
LLPFKLAVFSGGKRQQVEKDKLRLALKSEVVAFLNLLPFWTRKGSKLRIAEVAAFFNLLPFCL